LEELLEMEMAPYVYVSADIVKAVKSRILQGTDKGLWMGEGRMPTQFLWGRLRMKW
jgi:hypothetical protein